MVGHHDRIDADLDRDPSIFGGHDPLDEQRHGGRLADPGEVIPREVGRERELVRRQPDRHLELVPRIAMTESGVGEVHREADGREPRRMDTTERVDGHAAIGEHVELPPFRCVRGGRDVLEVVDGRGRDHHDRLGLGRRARGGELPVRVRAPLIGPGRDEHRGRQLRAEHLDRRIRRPGSGEHPRPDHPALEGAPVLREGPLVPGPARVVIVDVGRQALPRERLVVVDREDLRRTHAAYAVRAAREAPPRDPVSELAPTLHRGRRDARLFETRCYDAARAVTTAADLRAAAFLKVVTWARVALIPVILALILAGPDNETAFTAASVLFAIAALTDFFDGLLARRWAQTSVFGNFLDTTADKLLVSGALVGAPRGGARLAVDRAHHHRPRDPDHRAQGRGGVDRRPRPALGLGQGEGQRPVPRDLPRDPAAPASRSGRCTWTSGR